MPRLAWFTPLPPVRSGIARYNWDLLPSLAHSHELHVFVDGPADRFRVPSERIRTFSAHDFIWRNRQQPYDLIVYQLGNAPCHEYMWAYLTRHAGLVVLHDGQLHHARGRMLLQQWRPRDDDYRQEFWFNHPDAHRDLAELGVAGLLGSLTYLWPMLRVVVESSRRVLVHNDWLGEQIRAGHPDVPVDVAFMGVGRAAPGSDASRRIRSRHNIPGDAALFTSLGLVTPEKRIREVMYAMSALRDVIPRAHLLLAGEAVEYYDMEHEAGVLGIAERVTTAGYVAEEEIDDYLAASDVCLCMRWPTSRETSASWLRCLAAGKPTISTDLVHTVEVPTVDPRNWSTLSAGTPAQNAPVGVSIDILDEDHSLKLALRRLATDEKFRVALGTNARALWAERFQLEGMAAVYEQAIARTLETPVASAHRTLPAHLMSDGSEHAESLVREITGSEYHLRDAD